MLYQCPKCKKKLKRDWRTDKIVRGKKSFMSYCEETEQMVRVKIYSEK